MIRLELFDGTKTYMFPNGDIATPEKIRQQFPAVDYCLSARLAVSIRW